VPGSFVFDNIIQELTVNHKFIDTRLLTFDLKHLIVHNAPYL
jgi:hypothetical protein